MNRSATTLAALALGLAAGAAVRSVDNGALTSAAELLQPIGTLWLNALKMTLVPLVFAMVANGMIVLDRSGSAGGRLLAVTVPLLIGLLALAMALSMGLGLLFDRLWPVTRGALAGLHTHATAPIVTPSPTELLTGLVPTNPVAAASNGAMAALVVFAIVFGFAVSRTSTRESEPVAAIIHGLAAAMIRIVQWVLWFTPLDIFVLSLGLALHTGLAVAGFMAQLIVTTIVTALIAIVFGYGIAWTGGGIPPWVFGPAVLGPQAMAAGTCSSAASLPAMLEASAEKLHIPDAIGGAVLPLAASIFRFGIPFYAGAVLVLLMRAFDLPLDPARLAIGGALLVFTNLGSAGLPGAAVIYSNWSATLVLLGVPLDVVPLLIAANSLPDVFITTANVTADLAVTTVVRRLLGDRIKTAAGELQPA